MQLQDLAKDYQGKTDEELLLLEMDSDQLSSEAKAYLAGELARRGINAEVIRAFRDARGLYGAMTSERNAVIAPPLNGLGTDSYTIALPSTETSKAPWRPKVAARIAFFLGPFAGALVVAISLRRMGYGQNAKKAIRFALLAAVVEAVILYFVPDILSRVIGLGAEIAFLLVFPAFMQKEFSQWQADHPRSMPSNGWNAVGWGVLGSVLFVAILFVTFMVLAVFVPGA